MALVIALSFVYEVGDVVAATCGSVAAVDECVLAVIFRLPAGFEVDRAGRPWVRAPRSGCGPARSPASVQGWT